MFKNIKKSKHRNKEKINNVLYIILLLIIFYFNDE